MLAEALLWDLGYFAGEQKVYREMKCERVQTDCQAAVGKEGEGREQRRHVRNKGLWDHCWRTIGQTYHRVQNCFRTEVLQTTKYTNKEFTCWPGIFKFMERALKAPVST